MLRDTLEELHPAWPETRPLPLATRERVAARPVGAAANAPRINSLASWLYPRYTLSYPREHSLPYDGTNVRRDSKNRDNEQRRAAQPRQILGQIWEISALPWPVPPVLKNARMPHSLPRCALHSH